GGTGTKGAGYDSPYPDGSINLTLVVRLLADGQNWIVHVEPAMVKFYAGRPNPERLAPNDPAVPGWATGQVDALQYEIYETLKNFEVKSPGGVLPAPEPAPIAPAPTEGTGAPGATTPAPPQ
nr:hypothetical protein [Deltaproteobacteria bacterium]